MGDLETARTQSSDRRPPPGLSLAFTTMACTASNRAERSANRVRKQEFADPLAARPLIARQPPNQSGWNRIVSRQSLRVFRRQVAKGQSEGAQAIKTHSAALFVDRDEDPRDVAPVVQSNPLRVSRRMAFSRSAIIR
jgi:hypothetical protein